MTNNISSSVTNLGKGITIQETLNLGGKVTLGNSLNEVGCITASESTNISSGNENSVVRIISSYSGPPGPKGPKGDTGPPGQDGNYPVLQDIAINRINDEISSLVFGNGKVITINRVGDNIVSLDDGTYLRTISRINDEIIGIIVTEI